MIRFNNSKIIKMLFLYGGFCMNKMYRINYIVDSNKASCTIYTYPILNEKNTYFLIRSGQNNRQIKKIDVGNIKNVDIDKTGYYVFITELENKDMYIKQMIEKIKENAQRQVLKFKTIQENAVKCNIEIVDVEPE